MKYLESEFYRCRWHFVNQSYATIKNWFNVKDTFFRGIKHVTKRRRRSLAIRDLNLLYGCTLVELAWEERFCDEIGAEHGVTCEKPKKHRIYVYHY